MYFFLATLFSISIAHAGPESWKNCKANTDCAKVPTTCARTEAVNKLFVEDQAKLVEKMSPLSSCLQPTPENLKADKEALAICEGGKCALQPPAKATTPGSTSQHRRK